MLRLIGFLLFGGGILGVVGEIAQLEFPTVRWPFHMSRDLALLRFADVDGVQGVPWFGWFWTGIAICAAIYILLKSWFGVKFSPITLRRMQRFREIKRGYVSLWIILFLAGVASLDHLLVGAEALAVKSDGEWFFPALTRKIEKGRDFGVSGELADAAADYRKLALDTAKGAGKVETVIMPLLPYAPTGDTLSAVALPLKEEGGRLYERGEP